MIVLSRTKLNVGMWLMWFLGVVFGACIFAAVVLGSSFYAH